MTTNAKAAFKARVREWAQKPDVQVVWLGMHPMRRKWASSSTMRAHLGAWEQAK